MEEQISLKLTRNCAGFTQTNRRQGTEKIQGRNAKKRYFALFFKAPRTDVEHFEDFGEALTPGGRQEASAERRC